MSFQTDELNKRLQRFKDALRDGPLTTTDLAAKLECNADMVGKWSLHLRRREETHVCGWHSSGSPLQMIHKLGKGIDAIKPEPKPALSGEERRAADRLRREAERDAIAAANAPVPAYRDPMIWLSAGRAV
jgi:hypothetical protein